jgi:general secretion pathway protein E/type IV pilus assembly protein PilB
MTTAAVTELVLVAHLKAQGVLSAAQIDFCLQEQKVTQGRLAAILERCGFVSEEDLLSARAALSGLQRVDLNTELPDALAVGLFNATLCRRNQCFPLRKTGDGVVLATSHDQPEQVQALAERVTGLPVTLVLAERQPINRLITHHYEHKGRSLEAQLEREVSGLTADRDAALRLDSMIVALVRMAVQRRATDIHIRPMEHVINIAFRVDGVMRSVLSLESGFQRLIATVKLMSGMDIAEQRRAQDGSFELSLDEDQYDIRVSTLRTAFGENVVMRLLPRNQDVRRIDMLGFAPEHKAQLLGFFQRPAGIVLLTGPTGSGKTTTLHAGIMSLDVLNKNILTIEDPIEYRLPVVRQTEVNVKGGHSFAGAIRNFLRHDPDVIVVGEIRDAETAAAALDAAETGHLVLSTMHTNNAIGIVPRLKSLQADTHQLADVLVGAVSQRLVRRLCPVCSERAVADATAQRVLGLQPGTEVGVARGCAQCDHSGYLGRTPIYELVEFTDALRAAVHAEASPMTLYEIARQGAYVSMAAVARSKVLTGETSFDEVCFYLTGTEDHGDISI